MKEITPEINHFQSTLSEKQLENRFDYISPSRFACAMGIDPYKSKLELYNEYVNEQSDFNGNEKTHWGSIHESCILEEYCIRFKGVKDFLLPEMDEPVEFHPKFPFVGMHFDAKRVDDRILIEAKTVNQFYFNTWKNKVPINYLCQIQGMLWITGFKICHLVILVGGSDWKCYQIERDDEDINMIEGGITKFWDDMLKRRPPDPDGSESYSNYLKGKYDQSIEGKSVNLDGMAQALEEYPSICEELEKWEAAKKQIQNVCKQSMGDAETATCGRFNLSWKSSTVNRLDSKKFKAEFPDLYQDLTNETTQRRFSIKWED